MCTGSETDTSGFRSLDSVAPIVKVRRTNRCLFGRPDPEETLAMVRDELKRQQDHFFRRYIVVEEMTESTRNVNCIFERLGHRRPSRLRTTPYRQLLITGMLFYFVLF